MFALNTEKSSLPHGLVLPLDRLEFYLRYLVIILVTVEWDGMEYPQ